MDNPLVKSLKLALVFYLLCIISGPENGKNQERWEK